MITSKSFNLGRHHHGQKQIIKRMVEEIKMFLSKKEKQ